MKLMWYIKQLFPLTYRSLYKTADNNSHFAVWKMWFGHVFNYNDVVIKDVVIVESV